MRMITQASAHPCMYSHSVIRSTEKRLRHRDSLSSNVPEDGEEEEDNQVHNKDPKDDVQEPGVEGRDEEICGSVGPRQRALASWWPKPCRLCWVSTKAS